MAKTVFIPKKPHANVGTGCLEQFRLIAIGFVLAFGVGLVILVALPDPALGDAVGPFNSARAVIGRSPIGGADDFGVGYDPTCPQGAPFRCDDGSCVLTPSMCDPGNNCPPDMPLQCVDGQCVAEPGDCDVFPDCPGVTPYQCPNGACEPAPSYCEDLPVTSSDPDSVPDPPAACPEGWFTCSDGSCAVTLDECPPPEEELPGADGSLCGDGICQAGESPDWCGDCGTDGGESGDGGDSGDGSGDGNGDDEGCPEGQFLCPDGSCARTPSACEEESSPDGPGDLTS